MSGRLLVGLRWYNLIDENGKSHWQFQSFEVGGPARTPHPMHARPHHCCRANRYRPAQHCPCPLPQDQRFIHPTDSNVFWAALFAFPVVWVIMAFGAALTFKFMWLLLVCVALGLNMINVVGYVQCKRDAGKKLSALGGAALQRGLQAWSGVQMPGRGSGGVGSGSAPI